MSYFCHCDELGLMSGRSFFVVFIMCSSFVGFMKCFWWIQVSWFKVRVGYLNSGLRFIIEVIEDFKVKNNSNASMVLLRNGGGLNHPQHHHFHLRGFFKPKKKSPPNLVTAIIMGNGGHLWNLVGIMKNHVHNN